MATSYETQRAQELQERAQRRADFEALLAAIADRVELRNPDENRQTDQLVFIHEGREFHAWTRFDDYANRAQRLDIRLSFDHLPGFTNDDQRGYFKDIYQSYQSDANDAKPRNSITVGMERPPEKIRADILRRLGPVAAAAEDEIKARIADRLQYEDAQARFIAAVSKAVGRELTMRTGSGGYEDVLGMYHDAVQIQARAGRRDLEIKLILNAHEPDQWNKKPLTTDQAAEVAAAVIEIMRAYAAKYN